MGFRITQKTLESLEWPQLVAKVAHHCRTPRARLRLGYANAELHADDEGSAGSGREGREDAVRSASNKGAASPLALAELAESVREVSELVALTSEARELLETGDFPPLGGTSDLRVSLRRARTGGVLSASDLLEVRSTLEALGASIEYLAVRGDRAPGLAALAEGTECHPELERRIGDSIDLSGDVKDSASPALAQARRDVHGLSAQLQQRLERYLRDPDLAKALSDSYYTQRNDRYVLPVRADSKGRVRGIVHDASRSGTTLFIEPEAVVDLNNRLKQAELTCEREIERVLRDLSREVAEVQAGVDQGLDVLASIDLAFARAHLSIGMNATAPAVGRDGVFHLPELRHPLLPQGEAIPNDLDLGGGYTVLVISGPNGGGKTVAMKAVGLAAVMVRMGLHVPAANGARVDLVDDVLVDIGDGQDLRESLSTFSAHLLNLTEIVASSSEHTLVLLDEVGVGTDPSEGAALAQAVLEELANRGARVITTTHYNLLKEMAEVDERFCNASVEFDPDTLAPTFRLHVGTAGVSSATAVAARMGMSARVLDRANALLEREDRQLDQMLSELANNRAILERERQEATRVRAEGEVARDEYRTKLERLQERRDQLFQSMREDLDRTFGDAHAQVAAVIRDLQRSGQGDTKSAAHGAAHARERLLRLEDSARAEEAAAEQEESRPETKARPIDWRRATPGDRVVVPGGRSGVLESLPDRRGRVRVRVGSATLQVESDRVSAGGDRPSPESTHATVTARHPGEKRERSGRDSGPRSADATIAGGTLECDLRGQRVHEAIDRLVEALDRALHEGHELLRVIHGFGTGALRSAVREELHSSPHVESYRAGERNEGGDGVTLVQMRH